MNYLFYPYDTSELPIRKEKNNNTIKIVHSPTNRKYKGTELIVSVIDKIKKERKIEFLLLENIDRTKLLEIKSECDISIDQVGGTMGGTGYGKAGLETLAMSIPTITNMTKDYADWLPENPFVVANNFNELYKSLIELIDNESYRVENGKKGIAWVEKYHSFKCERKSYETLSGKRNYFTLKVCLPNQSTSSIHFPNSYLLQLIFLHLQNAHPPV